MDKVLASAGGAVLTLILIIASLWQPVIDDEPLFADPARMAAAGHGFGSSLLGALLPGAGDRVLWQPPGHPVLLALWFKVFGFGLTQGRALSAVAMGLTAAALYLLCRCFANRAVSTLAVAFAIATPWALSAGEIIRMDALSCAAVAWTMFLYARWMVNQQSRWLVASAGAAALAILFHPMGATAAVAVGLHIVFWFRRGALRPLAIFSAVIVTTVCVAWGAFVVGHWAEFLKQMRLQLHRKAGLDPLFLLHGDSHHVLIALTIVFAFGALLARSAWRDWRVLLAMLWIAIAVAFATKGGEAPYPVYVVIASAPLIALAASLIARPLARAMIAVVIVSVALETGTAVEKAHSHERASSVGEALAGFIPPGQSVFIGPVAGSVYFALPASRANAQWIPVGSSNQALVAAKRNYLVIGRPPTFLPTLDSLAKRSTRVGEVAFDGTFVQVYRLTNAKRGRT